jgi:diguanylate cyclase (GGDEF)-like protein
MAQMQVEDGNAVEHAQLNTAVAAEQLRLLTQKRFVLSINLLNAGITCIAFRKLYPLWLVGLWFGLFCVVILIRALTQRRYQGVSSDSKTTRRWGQVFALSAFATGCLWGLTSTVILITPNPNYQVLIVFVLGGMMAGGIVSNAAYLPSMLSFMLPTIVPAIIILFTRPGITHIGMAVMLTIFAVVLIGVGRSINHSIVETFRLRIRQDGLVIKLRRSEAAMAEAQKIAHVGGLEFVTANNSFICTAETYRILGVDPKTFNPTFKLMIARIHPDDRAAVAKTFTEFVQTGKSNDLDCRIVMDDGSIKYLHSSSRTIIDAKDSPLRYFSTVQDVTESRIAENKLQFANILLKTEMEASPDGILVVDENRKVISFNQRFADIWKIPASDLAEGNDLVVLTRVSSSVKFPVEFEARVNYLYDHPGEDSHDEFETIDGRFIDRYTGTLTTQAKKQLGRVWFFRDVTERKQAAAQALRMARFDVLTGLANRSVFVEALNLQIARAQRGEKGFAVIYLDLDHFKDVNDTLGHPIGDALLVAVAERLESNTRASDTVARFGGDEFAVVVADVADPADVAILADKLIHALDDPYSIQGNEIYSSASIGIDLYGPDACDAETLLSHADVALYRAKSEGRSGYRFFTDAMDVEVRMQVSLGTELHEALNSGKLFLLYQPQVAVESGRITGVEALVRWRHPRRGILGPDIFIPVAEKIGMIVKVGHWVLLTACKQAKVWLDAGLMPVRTAVNLSALQFKSPIALENDIGAILAETALPPHLLELELTESVLMNASREHNDIILRLRRIGVTIAIDDFGTGYSSLDYLRRFPADRIKIAQNFVRHLGTMPGDVAIVRATIGLAREMGIKVIAEGVETEEQYNLLKSWGCAEVQGFYFAEPMTADDVMLLLQPGEILKPKADSVA